MLRESPSKAGLLRGIGIALTALFLAAPNAALADDECDPQVGTTPVVCDQATYSGGVTYDAVGDLFMEFTNTPASTIGGSGITLTGDGIESIDFDSAETETELRSNNGTSGPLLGVTTVDGDITIATEEVDADTANVTRAIYAESTGSGSIDITTTANSVDARGSGDSIGIEAVTNTGDIDVTVAGVVTSNFYSIRTETAVSAEATVNNSGIISAFSGAAAIRATGGAFTLNNDNRISGALDFTGLDDGYTFNNNAGAVWDARLGGGNVPNSDLGAGAINNAGTIEIGRAQLVSAAGATYTGINDGTLLLNSAILDGHGQADCRAPTITGCLDLSGGTTAGQTAVLVDARTENDLNPFAESIDTLLNPGVVIVDVDGGTTQAEHFVLHPDSDNYAEDAKYGSVIDTGGQFDYALLYNPNNQQHLLASVPQREGVEYVSFIQQGLSIWHTTSDAVAGRQADLQNGGNRGGWIRIVSEQTESDSTPTMTTHGNSFTYDNDYKLNTKSLIAGYDLTATDSHVIGVHMGIVAARQDYRSGSSSRDETRGATFGAYAGWWNEAGLTLDGTLNANMVTIDHEPGRGLETNESNVRSIGLRAEAGWRFPLAETFYVQPLATAAYVRANIEGVDLRDNDASFENTESQRAALGLRLGGDMDLTGDRYSRLKYWLTARAWEESAGDDAHVAFEVEGGKDLVIEDDLSGSFEEVGLGASLTNAEGNISVFLSGNLRSGDDTDSSNVTIGARMSW